MTVPSAGSPSDSTRRELEVPEPVALERVRGVPEEEVPERAAWASVGWSDAGGTGGAAVGGRMCRNHRGFVEALLAGSALAGDVALGALGAGASGSHGSSLGKCQLLVRYRRPG